jgi:hypothetical protein
MVLSKYGIGPRVTYYIRYLFSDSPCNSYVASICKYPVLQKIVL